MEKILVVGAGTMGRGIATVCALAGKEVYLNDLNSEILDKAYQSIKWSIENLAKKGKLNSDLKDILGRVKLIDSLEKIPEGIDFAIEAVVEDSSVKREVFKKIEKLFHGIMATNTSSIPIDDIASYIENKGNLIGMHFFNPPTLIRLVEIIPGSETSGITVEKTMELARSMGMETIFVKRDVPGFVVNRINLRIFDYVLNMAEKGVGIRDIDSVAKYRLMLPMGFFELFDFIGIDVLLSVFKEIGKRGFPVGEHKILQEKVKEGKFGMKSGEGFYRYEGKYSRANIPNMEVYSIDPLEIISPGINEASWIISHGIATIEEVEKGQTMGMGYREGILRMADGYGLDQVVEILKQIGMEPDPLLKSLVESGRLGMKSGKGFHEWPYRKVELHGIIYEKRGNHAFITFNRPEKMNSLDLGSWESLRKAMEIAEDDGVKCVFFTGNGRAFCTGDDIPSMYSISNEKDAHNFFSRVKDAFQKLLESKIVLVALVDGFAYGGGAEMLLTLDIVLSSYDSRFAFSESRIGAIPPVASTLGISLLGRKIVRYIITGDEMVANEALSLGLVDILMDKKNLQRAYYEYARKLESMDKKTIEKIKEVINMGRENKNLNVSLEKLIELSTEKSFKEGMKKFMER